MSTTTTAPTATAIERLLSAPESMSGKQRAEQAATAYATLVAATEYPATEQGSALKGSAKAAATRSAKAAQALLTEHGPALAALADMYATRCGRKRPESTPNLAVAGTRHCCRGSECVHPAGPESLPLNAYGTTGPVLTTGEQVSNAITRHPHLSTTEREQLLNGKVREPYCRKCRTAMRAAAKVARPATQSGAATTAPVAPAESPAPAPAEQAPAPAPAAA